MPTTSDVNQPCVGLATGTLEPDLRVNYEFGLVMGVGEFRQEQMYFVEHNYQANRSLHGFGTVYGLLTTLARPVGVATDVQVTVDTGMGIDQLGRAFIVRAPQCAMLGAWLAKQPAETLSRFVGADGTSSVYVVASYDECLDALVPIPGQPCSSKDAQQVPSRIRDAYKIEFRFEPPLMPAWDAARRLGELFLMIQLVPGLAESSSDEAELAALIRLLDQPDAFAAAGGTGLLGSPIGGGPLAFRLPRETARDALDRLASIWATEVRPRIPPDLSAPSASAEAGVLLARIDLTWQNGAVLDGFVVDNTVRPFVLHTQLLQELIYPPGEAGARQPSQEFATLQVRGPNTLRAWIHHPFALAAPPPSALAVLVDEGAVPITNVTPIDANVFDLDLADLGSPAAGLAPLEAGRRIALAFSLPQITMLTGGSLLNSVDAEPFGYVGRDGDQIVVNLIPDDRPINSFVTFRVVQLASDAAPQLHAWFHTETPITLPEVIQGTRGSQSLPTQFRTNPADGVGPPTFLWQLTPIGDAPLAGGDLLGFTFDLETIVNPSGTSLLASELVADQRRYLGWDGSHSIRAYHAVSIAAQAPPSRPPLPSVPFVTITARVNVDLPEFELWFHPTRRVDENVDRIVELALTLFAEMPAAEGQPPPDFIAEVPIQVRRTPRRNVWQATVINRDVWDKASNQEFPNHYLRFVFDPERILVTATEGDFRLNEYIAKNEIPFEGQTADGRIVSYLRV